MQRLSNQEQHIYQEFQQRLQQAEKQKQSLIGFGSNQQLGNKENMRYNKSQQNSQRKYSIISDKQSNTKVAGEQQQLTNNNPNLALRQHTPIQGKQKYILQERSFNIAVTNNNSEAQEQFLEESNSCVNNFQLNQSFCMNNQKQEASKNEQIKTLLLQDCYEKTPQNQTNYRQSNYQIVKDYCYSTQATPISSGIKDSLTLQLNKYRCKDQLQNDNKSANKSRLVVPSIKDFETENSNLNIQSLNTQNEANSSSYNNKSRSSNAKHEEKEQQAINQIDPKQERKPTNYDCISEKSFRLEIGSQYNNSYHLDFKQGLGLNNRLNGSAASKYINSHSNKKAWKQASTQSSQQKKQQTKNHQKQTATLINQYLTQNNTLNSVVQYDKQSTKTCEQNQCAAEIQKSLYNKIFRANGIKEVRFLCKIIQDHINKCPCFCRDLQLLLM